MADVLKGEIREIFTTCLELYLRKLLSLLDLDVIVFHAGLVLMPWRSMNLS